MDSQERSKSLGGSKGRQAKKGKQPKGELVVLRPVPVEEQALDLEQRIERLSGYNPLREALLGFGVDTLRLAQQLTEELQAVRRPAQYDRHVGEWRYGEWEPDWQTRQGARRDIMLALGMMSHKVELRSGRDVAPVTTMKDAADVLGNALALLEGGSGGGSD